MSCFSFNCSSTYLVGFTFQSQGDLGLSVTAGVARGRSTTETLAQCHVSGRTATHRHSYLPAEHLQHCRAVSPASDIWDSSGRREELRIVDEERGRRVEWSLSERGISSLINFSVKFIRLLFDCCEQSTPTYSVVELTSHKMFSVGTFQLTRPSFFFFSRVIRSRYRTLPFVPSVDFVSESC